MARLGEAWLGEARCGKVNKGGMMENQKVVKLEQTKKTIGERSIYTQNLIDRIKESEPGDIITYEEFENIIGMECRPNTGGYNYLYSAIRISQTEFGINMDNVATVGYKHSLKETVAEESVKRYRDLNKSINKRMKKRLRTLADGWEALPEKARVKATMARTLIAFSDHVLRPKNIEKLSDPCADGKALGFKKTIDLFE